MTGRTAVRVDGTRSSRVRWTILALLVGFSVASYIERINLSVAGRFIRDDLGATDSEIGLLFSVFLIGYTLAQVPSGFLADRYGPHRVLSWAAAAWFVLTIGVAATSGLAASWPAGALMLLLFLRFALGVAEAPTFPAAARAIASWFPSTERASANATIQAASFAGSALTLPLMATAISGLGWPTAMFSSALPALVVGVIWWKFARDTPAQHGSVSSEELAHITGSAKGAENNTPLEALRDIDKAGITFLSASYFFHGYAGYLFFFWFFTYLVEERGFTIAQSGWVGALPTAAAALFALLGGWVGDRLAKRFNNYDSRRVLLLVSGLVGAASLLVGAFTENATIAIVGFVFAIGTRGFVEASYWTLAIELGGRRTGVAAGTMNALCNIGGAISTACAPILVQQLGWSSAFAIAAGATALSGILAITIRSRNS